MYLILNNPYISFVLATQTKQWFKYTFHTIYLITIHYPARRGFFNGYHPYNRGICSLWRTFQQHLFKVFRWDRGSSPEKRLGSKTGDSSLKEAKSKRRYLGARGRAFCAMALASFNSNVLWSKLWVKRWILLQIAPSKNRPWKWLVSVPAIVLLRIRLEREKSCLTSCS